MQYRKKPVVIEARQFTSEDATEVYVWIKDEGGSAFIDPADGGLYIDTLEGDMRVSLDDYVIRGVQGEFYPCKPDIFEATYEAVS